MPETLTLDSYESGRPYSPAFVIASFPIQWYGIFYALGIIFAIAFILAKLRFYHRVETTPFYIFIFIAIPCIIFGARAWSFIIGDSQIGTTAFFNFQTGFSGLAIQGAVIFTIIAGLIWFGIVLSIPRYFANVPEQIVFGSKRKIQTMPRRVSMWVFADTIIPAVLIGQAIGRWGNFFNHEVYGNAIQNAISMGATKASPYDFDGITFASTTKITVDTNGAAFTQ